MSFSWTRVGALLHKELRDYRRNRFVIGTMAAVPVLFIILPAIQLIAANATGKNLSAHVGLSLLYMLVIPVTLPSVVCAYSVVGEREQGTLEPVLATPIRREEFLIAKALAAFVPTLVIAYAVFGIFLAVAALFAHPVIVSAIRAGTHVLVQLLFTPLLAGWAIWVGIAVSTRPRTVLPAGKGCQCQQSESSGRSNTGRFRPGPCSPPACCSACLGRNRTTRWFSTATPRARSETSR